MVTSEESSVYAVARKGCRTAVGIPAGTPLCGAWSRPRGKGTGCDSWLVSSWYDPAGLAGNVHGVSMVREPVARMQGIVAGMVCCHDNG